MLTSQALMMQVGWKSLASLLLSVRLSFFLCYSKRQQMSSSVTVPPPRRRCFAKPCKVVVWGWVTSTHAVQPNTPVAAPPLFGMPLS
jgi:hypothetical protein